MPPLGFSLLASIVDASRLSERLLLSTLAHSLHVSLFFICWVCACVCVCARARARVCVCVSLPARSLHFLHIPLHHLWRSPPPRPLLLHESDCDRFPIVPSRLSPSAGVSLSALLNLYFDSSHTLPPSRLDTSLPSLFSLPASRSRPSFSLLTDNRNESSQDITSTFERKLAFRAWRADSVYIFF